MNSQLPGPVGMIRISSAHSVTVTVNRLKGLLAEHGIELFAHIDFGADAQRAGLQLPAEQLLIFGNPKAGTPLMQAAPSAGLDLPLKALVWEATDGITQIAYNDPLYILQRHQLSAAFSANLAAVVPLIERAAQR